MIELRILSQFGIGIIFLLSSAGKLVNFGGFRRAIEEYKFVPKSLIGAVGFIVILFEGVLAITHLTGRLLIVMLPAAILMLTSFAVAVAVNLVKGRKIPCYCFGDGDELISAGTLTRVLIILSGEVLLLKAHEVLFPERISLPMLGLGLFWVIFALLVSLWIFKIANVIDLVRPLR